MKTWIISIPICKFILIKRKITNKDRKVLTRIRKGIDNNTIEKNISDSLKNNKMDLVDPFDNTLKNSLFFRLNISGRIESANVK